MRRQRGQLMAKSARGGVPTRRKSPRSGSTGRLGAGLEGVTPPAGRRSAKPAKRAKKAGREAPGAGKRRSAISSRRSPASPVKGHTGSRVLAQREAREVGSPEGRAPARRMAQEAGATPAGCELPTAREAGTVHRRRSEPRPKAGRLPGAKRQRPAKRAQLTGSGRSLPEGRAPAWRSGPPEVGCQLGERPRSGPAGRPVKRAWLTPAPARGRAPARREARRAAHVPACRAPGPGGSAEPAQQPDNTPSVGAADDDRVLVRCLGLRLGLGGGPPAGRTAADHRRLALFSFPSDTGARGPELVSAHVVSPIRAVPKSSEGRQHDTRIKRDSLEIH